MHAVLKTGGKQYRVSEGDIIQIEKLTADVDSTVQFDEILMVINGESINVGQPFVSGATVTAKVLEQARHKKIKIVKFKRRKHQEKTTGHRQSYTAVKIEKISAAA